MSWVNISTDEEPLWIRADQVLRFYRDVTDEHQRTRLDLADGECAWSLFTPDTVMDRITEATR